MLTKEDLELLTKAELEETILDLAKKNPIIEHTINKLINIKFDDKIKTIQEKIDHLTAKKNNWLDGLKQKYQTEDNKTLIRRFNFEERLRYTSLMKDIDDCYNELNKKLDEEEQHFKRRLENK